MNLTREQVTAIRHLADCASYARDENGEPLLSPFYVSMTEQALKVVDRLLKNVEEDNVRRERPRSLEVAK